MNHLPILTAVLATAAICPAQATFRVVPNAYANLEGTSASRSPLGWPTSRIQYLVDSAEVCNSTALITGLQLRLDGGNFNVDAPTPQTLSATIDAYEVALRPNQMTNTWASNIAGAQATRVLQGTINVPAATRQYPWPNPWVVTIPLQQPFLHQRVNGNLLLDWDIQRGTGDNWPADAIFLRGDEARGEVTKIWEEPTCANSRGDALQITVPTSGNNGIIGQPLAVDYTAFPSPGANIDLVNSSLGLSKDTFQGVPLPIPLSFLGAPNCQWNVEILASQTGATITGGVGWPLPLDQNLIGVAVFTQAVGLDSAANVSVPGRNAWQVRLGATTAPSDGPLQMVHRGNYANQTTGFLSPTGYYGLVMGFQGQFF